MGRTDRRDTTGAGLNVHKERERNMKKMDRRDTIAAGLNVQKERDRNNKKTIDSAGLNETERVKKRKNSEMGTINAEQGGAEGEKKMKRKNSEMGTINAEQGGAEREKKMKRKNSEMGTVNAEQGCVEGEKKMKRKNNEMGTINADQGGAEGEKQTKRKNSEMGTVNAEQGGGEGEKQTKRKRKNYSEMGTVNAEQGGAEGEKQTKRKNSEMGTVNAEQGGADRDKKMERKSKTAVTDIRQSGVEKVAERKGNSKMENTEKGLNGAERRQKTRKSKNETLDTAPHCAAGKERMRKDCVQSGSLPEKRNWKNDRESLDLRGGRYTQEETLTIKRCVVNYIEKREWSFLEGLKKILCTSKHKDARGCWIEISKNLPSRPIKSIFERARRIYEGSVKNYRRGKWLVNEVEELTRLQKLHGENWAKIATYMNRSPEVCKDKWRHLKVAKTYSSGPWKQHELDNLCKLVRECRRMKVTVPPKKIDRREVREDISWEWISEEMSRDSSRCAKTWYHRLASSMISENKWTNKDDSLLLQNLLELGAKSEKYLKWETIIDDKAGDVCKRRWMEMTKCLDKRSSLSFKDKLELLAKRYAPELLGIEEP